MLRCVYGSFFTLIILIGFIKCSPARRSILDDVTNFFFQDKCMGELGCFSNGPPFFSLKERPISLLPQDRETIGTNFRLYTPHSKSSSLNFTNSNASASAMWNIGYRPSQRTIFIIHGYMADLAPVWMEPMKDALLNVEECNVFIVVWHGGDGPIYEQAVANTRVVGAEVAFMVNFLQRNFGTNPESVYMIGHSLGAHTAGYAGKRIQNLGRITGLDPAGPYFEDVDSSVRLNSTDAILVDVIHTDAATNRFQGFGTTESIGDLDFFVNGGSTQPGCPHMGTAIWDFLIHPSLHGPEVIELMCHHHRSIELMITSMISNRDCLLLAGECDSWEEFSVGHCGTCNKYSKIQENRHCIELGYDADKYDRNGVHLDLFLKTSDKPPFCIENGK